MTGDAGQLPDGWSLPAYIAHNEALREADHIFQEERDRRYAEVSQEREKALAIKNEADKAALGLAREIQTYKDEKANELREQINSERGLYATKDDVLNSVEKVEGAIKPLAEYISAQQGRTEGLTATGRFMVGLASVLGAVLIAIGLLANHL